MPPTLFPCRDGQSTGDGARSAVKAPKAGGVVAVTVRSPGAMLPSVLCAAFPLRPQARLARSRCSRNTPTHTNSPVTVPVSRQCLQGHGFALLSGSRSRLGPSPPSSRGPSAVTAVTPPRAPVQSVRGGGITDGRGDRRPRSCRGRKGKVVGAGQRVRAAGVTGDVRFSGHVPGTRDREGKVVITGTCGTGSSERETPWTVQRGTHAVWQHLQGLRNTPVTGGGTVIGGVGPEDGPPRTHTRV